MLDPVRLSLGIQTRDKKKKRSKTFHATLTDPDGSRQSISVPIDQLPEFCPGIRWPTPGIIRRQQPLETWNLKEVKFVLCTADETLGKLQVPDNHAVEIGTMDPFLFGRMLAKIGHAMLVGVLGMQGFEACLPPIILGMKRHVPYLVGGDQDFQVNDRLPPDVVHEALPWLYRIGGVDHWCMLIRLLAFMGTPRYVVVGGRANPLLLDEQLKIVYADRELRFPGRP